VKTNILKEFLSYLPLLSISLFAAPLAADVSAPNASHVENSVSKVDVVDTFLLTIQKRLDLMPDVAKWKWNETQPILSASEESALLEEVARKAQERGIDPEAAKSFFQSQIEAAKIVQIEAFEAWTEEGVHKVDGDVDYESDIQPKLRRANSELMIQLHQILPMLDDPEFQSLLKERAKVVLSAHSDEVQSTSIESVSAEN